MPNIEKLWLSKLINIQMIVLSEHKVQNFQQKDNGHRSNNFGLVNYIII